ncbi:uncharacterized protein I206_106552 [Kwoniella pini CBS 10737]|uniref:Uncharacterized protein n=1 Tax=Kwoniella pini CBS 10737 TaxID=1296096 RepID=A0A1B9HTV5_9TREE|nr:uncharacterized protein I206_07557 [Kwoniella pini CBS 10737]OCF46702.1 hypothetical protein I206_07557 [Kwoniella pini CBS 10737]
MTSESRISISDPGRLAHPEGDYTETTLIYRRGWQVPDGKKEFPLDYDIPNILNCSENTAIQRYPSVHDICVTEPQLTGQEKLSTEILSANLRRFAEKYKISRENVKSELRRLNPTNNPIQYQSMELTDTVLESIRRFLPVDATSSFGEIKHKQTLSVNQALDKMRERLHELASEKSRLAPHLDGSRMADRWIEYLKTSIDSRNASTELEMTKEINRNTRSEGDDPSLQLDFVNALISSSEQLQKATVESQLPVLKEFQRQYGNTVTLPTSYHGFEELWSQPQFLVSDKAYRFQHVSSGRDESQEKPAYGIWFLNAGELYGGDLGDRLSVDRCFPEVAKQSRHLKEKFTNVQMAKRNAMGNDSDDEIGLTATLNRLDADERGVLNESREVYDSLGDTVKTWKVGQTEHIENQVSQVEKIEKDGTLPKAVRELMRDWVSIVRGRSESLIDSMESALHSIAVDMVTRLKEDPSIIEFHRKLGADLANSATVKAEELAKAKSDFGSDFVKFFGKDELIPSTSKGWAELCDNTPRDPGAYIRISKSSGVS